MVVKAMGYDGTRLNIRRATLREWRRQFARHLREHGVAANATERAVRGVTKPQKQDEAKPENRQQESRQQESREADKAARQEHPDQQRANARSAGKGQRIPDDKFRQHFGREHVVVINRPVIVEGRPRFQTGGYWFEIVDPWPSDWLYTDQVYVDYIDGEYFLFNVAHPGVRIALFVTL